MDGPLGWKCMQQGGGNAREGLTHGTDGMSDCARQGLLSVPGSPAKTNTGHFVMIHKTIIIFLIGLGPAGMGISSGSCRHVPARRAAAASDCVCLLMPACQVSLIVMQSTPPPPPPPPGSHRLTALPCSLLQRIAARFTYSIDLSLSFLMPTCQVKLLAEHPPPPPPGPTRTLPHSHAHHCQR